MQANSAVKRDFRNLANITESASTSRILNLALVTQSARHDEELAAKPFFGNAKLNRAILIKHTLRPNELELFRKKRRTATKVILPFDVSDLRLGGESMFIDQLGFDKQMLNIWAGDSLAMQHDMEVMRILDVLPSLDPFIVREALNRRGYHPAQGYLKISSSDISSMIAFANEEIERLVQIAFRDAQSTAAMRFTGKILAHDLDAELDPLKDTLKLNAFQFAEGIFSWRGFLYFKWRHAALQGELRRVIEGLAKYLPSGFIDAELRGHIMHMRPRLARRILAALGNVGRIISYYDSAYASLTEGRSAQPFREFLLEGPKMFYELGEHVGILTHISSFWAYRVGNPLESRLTPLEYADTLIDFEDSLAGTVLES